MATYIELRDLLTNQELIDRITVAVLAKADMVAKDAAATAAQKRWAYHIIAQAWPRGAAVECWTQLLMDNRDRTLALIQNATDTDPELQTIVNAFIDARVLAALA